MRYHYKPISITVIWNIDNAKRWRGGRGDIGTLIDCCQNTTNTAIWKIVW